MFSLSLAVVLAACCVADLSPGELIQRLASPDLIVRDEASRTLQERGLEALPALRAARKAAEDAEARARLADLIDRIEAGQLDRPTMVALDGLADIPLREAVEALAARSGFALKLDAPAIAGRRVTFHVPGRLPFWEAVDRLGRAGHVRHDPAPHRDEIGDDPQASVILLVDGDPPPLTAYSGPVRIHLFGTHRHRDLNFQPRGFPPAPPSSATVIAEVQAFAEPGRFLDPNGQPRLEAIDDKGQTSPANERGIGQPPSPAESAWLIPGRLSLLHWHVPLGLPDPPPRPLVKLRGALPVILSTRKPDPLVILLSNAVGKTFRHERVVVRVDQVSARDPRNAAVTLLLSEDERPGGPGRTATEPETDPVTELVRNRLEFVDDAGRPLVWKLLFHRSPTVGRELRLQMSISGRTPPVRLHVYRLNRLATEIPFEIDNVPTP